MRRILILVLFLFGVSLIGKCQVNEIDQKYFNLLDSLSDAIPGMRDTLTINLSQSELDGFLTAIGRGNSLNIGVDSRIRGLITANFSQETIANILKYVVSKFELDISLVGSIMEFKPREPLPAEVDYEVIYYPEDSTITLKSSNANLRKIINEVVTKTEQNIVLTEKLGALNVSGYVIREDLYNALNMFALANNLDLDSIEGGQLMFIDPTITRAKTKETPNVDNKSLPKYTNASETVLKEGGQLKISQEVLNNRALLSVDAYDVELQTLVEQIFLASGVNHIFINNLEGRRSLVADYLELGELLSYLFLDTSYGFEISENSQYIVGKSGSEGVRSTKLLSLKFRKVIELSKSIPKDLSENLEITEFPELNSIIASGSKVAVEELESFLNMVDKPVPVVMIELIIIDVINSNQLATGIKMGFGDEPVKTTGSIGPGLDVTLNGNTINSFFNSVGLGNIGVLSPNFYLTLTALEANGHIKINSTPRLATLNSYPASLNIGETSYYLEQKQNVVGTQNPQTIVTNEFKPVTADFTISILPYLSGDEHITLDVDVSQSNFTQRISPQAPPGQSTRQFKSSIRVQNGDMIILGGLERQEESNTVEGVPFLSRIPVVNLFFSNRNRRKQKSKLAIFIRPYVIG